MNQITAFQSCKPRQVRYNGYRFIFPIPRLCKVKYTVSLQCFIDYGILAMLVGQFGGIETRFSSLSCSAEPPHPGPFAGPAPSK